MQNPLQEKSYAFALKIIQLYKFLAFEKKEYILSKQILRSGTSIGANAEEATGAYSKKEFLSKITISYKEGRETHYWLRLLRDSKFIRSEEAEVLIADCEELLKIMTSIQKTTKQNLQKH